MDFEFPGWKFSSDAKGFELSIDGKPIVRHSRRRPWISAALGSADYAMFRGNFKISERITKRTDLRDWSARAAKGGLELELRAHGGPSVELFIQMRKGRRHGPEDSGSTPAQDSGDEPESLYLGIRAATPSWNFWRFRFYAEPGENVWGCGEQFSKFDLRGKRFPIWTSEQGVGRNKRTAVTRAADKAEGAGGDYWWTFFPQPSYVTRRKIRAHMETSAWSRFDFTGRDRFVVDTHALPSGFVFGSAASFAQAAMDNARFFGRQPEPPEWVHSGVILGIQGGTSVCMDRIREARVSGVPVAGLWAQDWEGIRMTSFGQRLMWNWEVDTARYPGFEAMCGTLGREGIRVLVYANCYLACDKPLFAEAERLGVLVKNRDGGTYRFDAGEFDVGIPDLTNPAGREWFRNVLVRNILDKGASGWMADFGEYLPTDCVLFDGTPARIAHNLWPALWARVNREAIDAAGKIEEATFFMRAGFAGSQRWCPQMWAGDQNVDWSADDGLPSVIPAALSLAMLGHGFHHSDVGGYTTLFGIKRSKELFLRWSELAAFTIMMRTHEGNRPKDNHQFYTDQETLKGLARMGRLKAGLAPYFRQLAGECACLGVPVLRPLFMVDEGDSDAYAIKDQFMAGEDLLVAPVMRKGARSRRVRLIEGRWIHLWSGRAYQGRGWVEVSAPIGEPPAFFREGSRFSGCFSEAAKSAAASADYSAGAAR